MKKMLSDSKSPIEGFFQVIRVDNKTGQESIIVDEKNLVVDQAALILRDLMFEGDGRITKFHFGDLNLQPTDDIRNVVAPSVGATELVHKIYEKTATKSKIMHNGAYAILYSVVLESEELNGNGEQLITEFALATDAGLIFSVKNRAGIYKDVESSLRFNWTLVFK